MKNNRNIVVTGIEAKNNYKVKEMVEDTDIICIATVSPQEYHLLNLSTIYNSEKEIKECLNQLAPTYNPSFI